MNNVFKTSKENCRTGFFSLNKKLQFYIDKPIFVNNDRVYIDYTRKVIEFNKFYLVPYTKINFTPERREEKSDSKPIKFIDPEDFFNNPSSTTPTPPMFEMEDAHFAISQPLNVGKEKLIQIVNECRTARKETKNKALLGINKAKSSTDLAMFVSSWILAHPTNGLKVL